MLDDITKLEYVLSAYARPTFLIITQPDEENDIQIVISCNIFETMDVQKRISHIFGLILKYIPEIINDRLIIIQAYSNDEMEDIIENIYVPEYNSLMSEKDE